MSSDKKTVVKLNDGWVLCTSKSNPGRKYYFNKRTGKSSWTQPQATEKSDRKHKNRKEKVNREKSKKEEAQKNNLKRKSDQSNEGQDSAKKKHKKEAATPTKQKPKNESPQKPTPTKETPEKQTPVKNAANQRLSQLRSRLSAEAQDDSSNSNDKSPVKHKQKISPKPAATETKTSRTETKSPTVTENKCNTSQSPSSDSLQSVPSPSQFFAANKIISSMKAQLPEEYCDKTKPKDTFADIEHGICNQTSEYPYLKHPATPPQFSEASKLVSAIKSKLTKVAGSDIQTFSSASDRMEALRKSLGTDLMDTEGESLVLSNIVSKETKCVSEAMEVDFKEIKQAAPQVNCTKDNINTNVVLVVDTNIFIHELDMIKIVLNSNIKGYVEQPTLLVPWRVVNELDRLKDNNNCNGAIWKRAKSAMDYLYKSIPENSRIRGQPLRDANSHIYPCESPDDEILNCALQQAERGKDVILLSNDKMLCSKAVINNIKSLSLSELKELLETTPQETDPDAFDNLKHYQATIYQLLANILENEMRAKYNNLWQHVLFKAPPWTLADVLQCLLKHWIAVFNEVFPRIEHLITDLKNALTVVDQKDSKSLLDSEVSNFKDLCLEVAKKCQIIPEYMELAKITVDRLLNDRACDAADEKHGELMVIDAFENVWTVMSSYCAKLSTRVGVPHGIEDKWPGDEPLHALSTKLHLFTSQISAFTTAIKGVLSSENPESSVEDLERAFKDSLSLICMDNEYISKSRLAVFCTKCRNMLQEAYTKFSQLMELIELCKNTLENQ
uniref:WW domain-containing protein n=1 Tax=Heliothis virescens TaxID=7102 RepID=A0A2A4K8H4_HELVI